MAKKWLVLILCLAVILSLLLACGPSSTTSQPYIEPESTKDTTPPALTITQPTNAATDKPATTVVGTTEPTAKVTINGSAADVVGDGSFSFGINLVSGMNTINILALDEAGNKTEKVVYITYNPPPLPPPPVVQQAAPAQTQEVTVYVTKTGECYHSSGCQYLRQSCIPISLSAAKQSYRP